MQRLRRIADELHAMTLRDARARAARALGQQQVGWGGGARPPAGR
jgi:hypothetical protein